jgi:hypothetical protein
MKKTVLHEIEFDETSTKKVEQVKLAVRSILNAQKVESFEPFQLDFWLMDCTGAVLMLDDALLEAERFCPKSAAAANHEEGQKRAKPEPLYVRFTWRAAHEPGADAARNILGPQKYDTHEHAKDGMQHRWNAQDSWKSPFDNVLSGNYVEGCVQVCENRP